MFNSNVLFASLIWGSVGLGYAIYGKRQRSWIPMVGGVLMMAASYATGSVVVMSLICLAIMGGVFALLRSGY